MPPSGRAIGRHHHACPCVPRSPRGSAASRKIDGVNGAVKSKRKRNESAVEHDSTPRRDAFSASPLRPGRRRARGVRPRRPLDRECVGILNRQRPFGLLGSRGACGCDGTEGVDWVGAPDHVDCRGAGDARRVEADPDCSSGDERGASRWSAGSSSITISSSCGRTGLAKTLPPNNLGVDADGECCCAKVDTASVSVCRSSRSDSTRSARSSHACAIISHARPTCSTARVRIFVFCASESLDCSSPGSAASSSSSGGASGSISGGMRASTVAMRFASSARPSRYSASADVLPELVLPELVLPELVLPGLWCPPVEGATSGLVARSTGGEVAALGTNGGATGARCNRCHSRPGCRQRRRPGRRTVGATLGIDVGATGAVCVIGASARHGRRRHRRSLGNPCRCHWCHRNSRRSRHDSRHGRRCHRCRRNSRRSRGNSRPSRRDSRRRRKHGRRRKSGLHRRVRPRRRDDPWLPLARGRRRRGRRRRGRPRLGRPLLGSPRELPGRPRSTTTHVGLAGERRALAHVLRRRLITRDQPAGEQQDYDDAGNDRRLDESTCERAVGEAGERVDGDSRQDHQRHEDDDLGNRRPCALHLLFRDCHLLLHPRERKQARFFLQLCARARGHSVARPAPGASGFRIARLVHTCPGPRSRFEERGERGVCGHDRRRS